MNTKNNRENTYINELDIHNTNRQDNAYVANLHIAFFLLCLVVLIMTELGFYSQTLLAQLRIGTAVMFGITLVVQLLGRSSSISVSRITKYCIISFTLVETLIILSILNFNALLMLCFPILVAMNYHSTKLMVYAFSGSAVCTLFFPVISLKLGFWSVDYLHFLIWCATGKDYGDFPRFITEFSSAGAAIVFVGSVYCFQIAGIAYGIYSSIKRKQKLYAKQLNYISGSRDSILEGMASVVENRDNNTGGHIKRTSEVVRILTKDLPLYESYRENIIKAAPLHDLGKIAVSDKILNKPARLSPEEFEQIKIHPEKGYDIIKTIFSGLEDEQLLKVAENIALYHHEKYDGSGYPKGLKGEEIPLEARIMAIADVYDALVSKRCYKNPMSQEEAYKVIKDSMGTHFDPGLWNCFEKAFPAISEYYSQE